MAIEGVDYADARPSPAGLYAAGKRFVVRYGGPGRDSKQLDATELKKLTAAGLSVVANAEGSAGGYRGRTAGRSWAQQAEDHFRSLGMPGDRPIYFSVDFDAGTKDWSDIDAALAGSAEIIGAGRVGVYGGYDTIAHCARAKTARWLWQTYAWSGGQWWAGAHMQQYRNGVTVAGGDCDLNRALVTDYGQWGQKEDLMAIDDSDAQKIAKAVWGYMLTRPDGPDAKGNDQTSAGAYQSYTDVMSRKAADAAAARVIAALGGDNVDEAAIVQGVLAGLGQAALTDALVGALKAIPKETADQVLADLGQRLQSGN